jgi:hypothetical protein
MKARPSPLRDRATQLEKEARSASRHSKEAVGIAVFIIISSHDFALCADRKDTGRHRVGYVDCRVDALAQDEAMFIAVGIEV